MIVDGQNLTRQEVRRLVDMFNKDCKEYAGRFFDASRKGKLGDAGRSEKFRAFWSEVGFRCGRTPQECYVESHYQNFAEDVRTEYARLLALPHVKEADKYRMHQAIIVQQVLGMDSQNTPVQMGRDSQQFHGDSFEVKEIVKNYGTHAEPSLIDKLMNSTDMTRRH